MPTETWEIPSKTSLNHHYLGLKFHKAYQMMPPHSREKTTKKISEPQMTKWLIQVQ